MTASDSTAVTVTPTEAVVLRLAAESGISGVQIRYVWTWRVGSQIVTRQVNRLRRKGLLDIIAFRGGNGAANLTDAGRAYLSSL